MWSSKPNTLTRRATLAAALIALSACGFAPVYGTNGTAEALRGQIEAANPSDRDGFVFVARLEERIGLPQNAPFRLDYTINIEREGVGITQTGDTTRFNLLGRVDYRVTDKITGKELAKGKVENFTGFSATGSIVGSITATEDAQERLMTILADQLVTELVATAPDWRQ